MQSYQGRRKAAQDRDHQTTEAERFVERFSAAWTTPAPATFSDLFAPTIRLIAPLLPVTNGIEQAEEGFASLFSLLPDMRGQVIDWVATSDGVIIDHVFRGTLGRQQVQWRGMDRFVLADGCGVERVHYADSRPVVNAAVRQPWLWPRLLRTGARPGAEMAPSRHLAAKNTENRDIDSVPSVGSTYLIAEFAADGAVRADEKPRGLPASRLSAKHPHLEATVLRSGIREESILLEVILSDCQDASGFRWPAVHSLKRQGANIVRSELYFDTLAQQVGMFKHRVARK
ncbi:nuclear transport factor 2 family protein [Mycobacterium sp. CVI_P3]|uniref:Nuclear transport factor 2 family protein n=1 Tax=Mycobacterium pinniadriaticum TaxID=2994102 RepID=A0ABT3S8R3_9MYCO|nr:nuclear transport factor 2 family protein [Mycobacterium pinniadriaticum]MCX2929464.1 nuclear transport factor 2 family protein [Mycobacterium pinniadriaticum]MCX2935888.1 nuclear transport factor 2 family protein [Mycobacterium pinniadriaticum]